MASARTVEQTRIERKASSDECNQKTSASKCTLSSWDTAASTGLLKLVRKSLPGFLRVHVGADALVPANRRVGLFGSCRSASGISSSPSIPLSLVSYSYMHSR